MTDVTLHIKTEDGEEYVADVKDFTVEMDGMPVGNRQVIKQKEYHFDVTDIFQKE